MLDIARLVVMVDPRKAMAGLKRVEGGIKGLQNRVFSLQGAFAALGGAIVLHQIKDATLAMERLGIAMKASAGSAKVAHDDLKFLERQTKRLSLGFMATSGAYQKFRAAASASSLTLEEQREIFLGVAEAASALRLSDQDTEGALRAIEQMVSKGKVSSEELRQQLGERLPGAVLLASQAMGMSERDFNKLLETGKIMATDMLPKLAVTLRAKFGKAAEEAGNTAAAAFTRADNEMLRLKDNLGKSGIISAMAAIKEAIISSFAKASDGAKGTGEGLMEFARAAILFAGALFDTFKPVIAIVATIGKSIMSVIEAFMEGFAALPPIVRQMGLFGAIFLGPMGRLAMVAVTTAMGLMDEFMALLGKVAGKLAGFVQKAADTMPTILGGGKDGMFQSMADGLKDFANEQANRTKTGKSYEQDFAEFGRQEDPNHLLTNKMVLDPVGSLMGAMGSDMGSGSEMAERIVAKMDGTFTAIEDAATASGENVGKNLKDGIEKTAFDAGAERYFSDLELNAISFADVTENAFKGMEDALTSFVTTGKMDFKGLIDSMIADLAKLMVQQYLMLPLKAALGFADGGIMTSGGSMPLRTYSRGGIANSPQLAMFGEGSRPEAYVPLPDGRTIPVTMQGSGGGGVNTTINVSVNNEGGGNGENDQMLATTIANVIDKKIGERLNQAVSNGGMLNPKGMGAGAF